MSALERGPMILFDQVSSRNRCKVKITDYGLEEYKIITKLTNPVESGGDFS